MTNFYTNVEQEITDFIHRCHGKILSMCMKSIDFLRAIEMFFFSSSFCSNKRSQWEELEIEKKMNSSLIRRTQ